MSSEENQCLEICPAAHAPSRKAREGSQQRCGLIGVCAPSGEPASVTDLAEGCRVDLPARACCATNSQPFWRSVPDGAAGRKARIRDAETGATVRELPVEARLNGLSFRRTGHGLQVSSPDTCCGSRRDWNSSRAIQASQC